MATNQKAQSLDELIAAAVDNPTLEADVITRILSETLYVHAPKNHRAERLSVVTFRTPQGVDAVPIFTDREKAEFAGRGNVRLVPVNGRDLLAALRGATVVINPNDNWCILYPEEIAAILDGKPLARVPERHNIDTPLSFLPANDPPSDLLQAIVDSLANTEPAIDAWLMQVDTNGDKSKITYVLVVSADEIHHERIARSLTLAIAAIGRALENPLDVTFVAPGGVNAKWVEELPACLIYRRSWLPGIKSGIRGNA